MNLKKVLMDLGNKLVMEYGYSPGVDPTSDQADIIFDCSTLAINLFTEWLNNHPDAINVLDEMGIAWPITGGIHEDVSENIPVVVKCSECGQPFINEGYRSEMNDDVKFCTTFCKGKWEAGQECDHYEE